MRSKTIRRENRHEASPPSFRSKDKSCGVATAPSGAKNFSPDAVGDAVTADWANVGDAVPADLAAVGDPVGIAVGAAVAAVLGAKGVSDWVDVGAPVGAKVSTPGV